MKTPKKLTLHIVRPRYEVELFGGPETVAISVGSIIRTHPESDLFMRGALSAEVRKIVALDDGSAYLRVRPHVMGRPIRGKLHAVPPEHVLVDEKGV